MRPLSAAIARALRTLRLDSDVAKADAMRAWTAVAEQGFFATASTTVLWNWGLNRVPASQAGIFVNLQPLVGAILGVSLLHEDLRVIAIAGGNSHSLALKDNGKVIVWGDNSRGQTNIPGGLSNVVAIAAGHDHSLALKSDGIVAAWGDNRRTWTSPSDSE